MKGLFTISVLILLSCNSKKGSDGPAQDNIKQRISLMEADKNFSSLCEEKGMKSAFVEYIDSNGVLLRPDMLPVSGALAIDYLIQHNDTGYVLKWQPHNATVSAAGDMGYTYGIYSVTPGIEDTTYYGTYINVWRKQNNGSWKFIVNSANEGIGTQ